MRNLNKNKTILYYALHRASEVIYKLDENGNKIVVYVDDTTTPPTEYYEEVGTTQEGYEKPVKFFGHIAFSGGDSESTEYGVSTAEYEAIVTVSKDLLPIDETSLIWTHEPLTDDDGYAIRSDADFRVLKIHPSLNDCKIILAKVQK